MSYLKDREIWLSSVPTDNPPAGYVWVFIQNGVFVVRDSNGVDKIMATTTGTVTNATSASYVEYSNVASKPALISGSSQVSYTGLSNTPAGIVSGSTQVSFNGITDKPALVSSSAQIVGYNVFATTGSNQFNGSQAVTGSLTVTGQVVAQTLNVQQVTSSIVYSSGSNIFGNSLGNTQQFTGSVSVTGSLAVAGAVSGTSGTLTGALIVENNAITQDGTRPIITLQQSGTSKVFLGVSSGTSDLVTGDSSGDAVFRKPASSGAFRFSVDGGSTSALTINSTGSATFNLGSGEMRLNRTGTSEYLKLNTYYLLTDGNDQLLGSVTGATSIYAGNGVSPRFSITSGGNVGIGTASPNANLDVQRVAGDSNDILRLGSNQNYYFGFSRNTSNGALQIQGNQTGYNNISLAPTSGNVGIGTATPNDLLTLYRNASQDNVFSLYQGTNGYAAAFKLIGNNDDGARYNNIGSYTNGGTVHWLISGGAVANTMIFYTNNNTERMRITSGGSVGIGKTGSINQVDIYYASGDLVNARTGQGQGNATSLFTGWASASPTTNGSLVFNVTSNGNVTNTNNSYGAISDIKLKENITDATPKLEDLLKVKIRNYNLIGQETKQIGVIAQELEEIFPAMIDESEDFEEVEITNEEGNTTKKKQSLGTTTKSVKYSVFVPMLIKAIQELKSENDNLKSRLEVLEQS